jgi:antagonist of KipI
MQVANALVGNNPSEAVIEMHFPGPVILFNKASLIAISGADFSPTINGDPININRSIIVAKNDILQFQHLNRGARAYLAIDEGYNIDPWLESCSTNIKAAAGGWKGRALIKGDEIPFKKNYPFKNPNTFKALPWKADTNWGDETEDDILLILKGHEWDQLKEESQHKFETNTFTISSHSDRMGYRIEDCLLERITDAQLISSGVSFGTIQLLPNGNLIILGADHQTAGGYPRIGHVISAHHSKLAQMNAGNKIQFKLTDISEAERLYFKQQQHLKLLEGACKNRLQLKFLNT